MGPAAWSTALIYAGVPVTMAFATVFAELLLGMSAGMPQLTGDCRDNVHGAA